MVEAWVRPSCLRQRRIASDLGTPQSRLGDSRERGGDEKPVTVIEDTAVAVEDFPDYILELGAMLRNAMGSRAFTTGMPVLVSSTSGR